MISDTFNLSLYICLYIPVADVLSCYAASCFDLVLTFDLFLLQGDGGPEGDDGASGFSGAMVSLTASHRSM